MKKVLAVLSFVAIAATFASAEMMSTANPVGQGKWAFLGSGLQNTNFANNSNYSLTTLGGSVGYGITNKLDAYLQLGLASAGGLPTGVSFNGTGIGVNLKYTLWEEGRDVPVTVATGIGYKTLNSVMKITGNPDQTNNGSQLSLGAAASKVFANFIPYSGLSYRKASENGADESSQIDWTIGSSIPWQNMGAFFVEYTLQNITPNGGGNYSSNQIGAGFGTTM